MSFHPSSASASSLERHVATGFDLEPLPSGDVLIEFFGDDGETVNAQVITRKALAQLPAVVHATFLPVDQGQDAALSFLDWLNAEKHYPYSSDGGTTDFRSGGDL